MAGQIIKRGERKFVVRVYAGTDHQTGKRRYVNKTVNGNKKDAETALNAMLRERDLGHLEAPSRVTMGDLFDDILRDYRINGKRLDWCEIVVEKHLRPFFGGMKASKLTTDAIERYVEHRHAEGVQNGTINREFTILRRSLNLGMQASPPKVARAPKIPRLKEAAPRAGFFEHVEYQAMLRELPEHLRPVLTFAYYTGCRRGEILALRWEQVDLVEAIVRLDPGTTKNDEARVIPLAKPLLDSLKMQRETRDQLHPESPWVFSRFGDQIRDFRGAWHEAAKRAADKERLDSVPSLWDREAKKPAKLFHDLRRTGVRNLVRAGVPERVAMAISGHKTRSVFDRYNIVSERDIKDAARMLFSYLSRPQLHDGQTDGSDIRRQRVT